MSPTLLAGWDKSGPAPERLGGGRAYGPGPAGGQAGGQAGGPAGGQVAGPAVSRPPAALTGTAGSGRVAGSWTTAPVVASKRLPWQGQEAVVPSTASRTQPRWVQT